MKTFAMIAAGSAMLAVSLAVARADDFTSATFATEGAGYVTFMTPSKNIECIYTPAGGSTVYKSKDGGAELSCDRAKPRYLRITLGAKGKAAIIEEVGDQGCCGAPHTLAYGQSWHGGPFYCESTENGLTCSRGDGHGFAISRKTEKAY